MSAEEQDWAKDKAATVDVVEIENSEGEEIMLKSNKDLDKPKSETEEVMLEATKDLDQEKLHL